MSDKQRCPVCKIEWPSLISCCPCGFAPSAIHELVVQLKRQRRRSLGEQVAGLLMVAASTSIMFVYPLSMRVVER